MSIMWQCHIVQILPRMSPYPTPRHPRQCRASGRVSTTRGPLVLARYYLLCSAAVQPGPVLPGSSPHHRAAAAVAVSYCTDTSGWIEQSFGSNHWNIINISHFPVNWQTFLIIRINEDNGFGVDCQSPNPVDPKDTHSFHIFTSVTDNPLKSCWSFT